MTGASGRLTGHSLDEFCKPLPSETPGTPCQTACPDSNGDPHLRTVNRYKYDFQAAGEFTLIRNADSSIEIQARQEPYHALGPSPFNAVSINTAVAARDNGHRIGVYMTPAGLALHVDGALVDPASLPDLGGGASIESVTAGFKIGFPDGTVLAVLSVSPWGVNAIVQPSDSLRSSAAGLLGPITPGGMGVPALPGGSQLPAAPDRATRDTVLYGQFADAWRVTDTTTLFDYDPGKSTATYTDRAFPSDVARAALEAANASPNPDQLAAAQSACAAVTDPDLLSDCEFDVYATGDDGFAQAYAATQDLFDAGINYAPASPAPSPAGAVTGAQKVVELQDLDGATIGPDNTVYVSITDSSGSPQLLAIDPVTAAVKQRAGMRTVTDLHFAAGSVWAAGQTTDANGQHCSVTRYDPQTLADQRDIPIPCANGYPGPHLTSMGDAVWFVDTTKVDPSTGAGAALTRIDPASNTPGKSVPLGYVGGCCQDSNGAVFCSCGQSDTWRLTEGDSSFVDLGNYPKIFPAGDGFWAEEGDSAVFVNAPGAPSVTIQLTGGSAGESVVGGDPTGVYLQGEPPDEALIRQPADGSAPTTLAKAPVSGSGIDQTLYDYGAGGFPWFATPAGHLNLWVFKATSESPNALWLQWAPIR